jgi:hypothetical protein
MNKLMIAVVLGAGGYAAYRYIYVPYRFRQQIAQKAAAAGMSTQDYLKRIGGAACQAYGAYLGVPPQVSGGVCNELASVAADVVRNLPEILEGVGRGTGSALSSIGGGAGSALSAIGGGAGAGIFGLGKGVADATLYPWEKGGGLVKDGAAAVYGGAKTVANAVNPVNVVKNLFGIGGGTNCSVPQQPVNAAWCRSQYGMASAPGSDAWARANNQAIQLTGAGSS